MTEFYDKLANLDFTTEIRPHFAPLFAGFPGAESHASGEALLTSNASNTEERTASFMPPIRTLSEDHPHILAQGSLFEIEQAPADTSLLSPLYEETFPNASNDDKKQETDPDTPASSVTPSVAEEILSTHTQKQPESQQIIQETVSTSTHVTASDQRERGNLLIEEPLKQEIAALPLVARNDGKRQEARHDVPVSSVMPSLPEEILSTHTQKQPESQQIIQETVSTSTHVTASNQRERGNLLIEEPLKQEIAALPLVARNDGKRQEARHGVPVSSVMPSLPEEILSTHTQKQPEAQQITLKTISTPTHVTASDQRERGNLPHTEPLKQKIAALPLVVRNDGKRQEARHDAPVSSVMPSLPDEILSTQARTQSELQQITHKTVATPAHVIASDQRERGNLPHTEPPKQEIAALPLVARNDGKGQAAPSDVPVSSVMPSLPDEILSTQTQEQPEAQQTIHETISALTPVIASVARQSTPKHRPYGFAPAQARNDEKQQEVRYDISPVSAITPTAPHKETLRTQLQKQPEILAPQAMYKTAPTPAITSDQRAPLKQEIAALPSVARNDGKGQEARHDMQSFSVMPSLLEEILSTQARTQSELQQITHKTVVTPAHVIASTRRERGNPPVMEPLKREIATPPIGPRNDGAHNVMPSLHTDKAQPSIASESRSGLPPAAYTRGRNDENYTGSSVQPAPILAETPGAQTRELTEIRSPQAIHKTAPTPTHVIASNHGSRGNPPVMEPLKPESATSRTGLRNDEKPQVTSLKPHVPSSPSLPEKKPSVSISIGTIHVKAKDAPLELPKEEAPTKKPARPSPQFTLNQYLASRTGETS